MGTLGKSITHPIELSSDEDEYPLTPVLLKTGGRTSNESSPQRPSIVSIEGIPGSGKSAILNILTEHFKDRTDVLVLREPTSIWEEIKLDEINLMDLYFKDQDRYGFIFQLVYFMAIERQLQRTLRDHSDKRVVICERSILSARTVYHEMLPVNNRVKYDIYQTLFQKEGVGNIYPDHVILLDVDPRECLDKTSRKNWRGEEMITLEYLQRGRRHHLEMKKRHSGGWTTIKGKLDRLSNTAEKIVEKVINTLHTVASDNRRDIPDDVMTVSLEGNIGAGKSTLLTEVEQRCRDRGISEIRILREPVDEWEKVTNGTKTILELFYENPAEYGFLLQVLVSITTMTRTHKELLNYPDTKVLLSERSILSSRSVFARMLRNKGFLDELEDKVYQMLFNGNEPKVLTNPAMMMYIDTDPVTCLTRVGERDRRGENRITLEELQRCESYHKALFRHTDIHVRSIERDQELNGEKINWVDTIIRWCQQLCRGKIPNQLTSPIKENLGKRDWWEGWEGKDIDNEIQRTRRTPYMSTEDLIEPIRVIKGPRIEHREELYLLKLKYGPFMYRFTLPDWELTNDRFTQEIEEAWPELQGQDISLSWKLIEKNSNGRCEDEHLNESINYIELMDGKTVDRIIEFEILSNTGSTERPNPPRITTCSETGDAQL
jgi:thymidylate kinase